MISNRPTDLDALRAQAIAEFETLSDGHLHEPEKPARDWKKIVLIFGLGALSWVATYIGMLELIQANMGTLALSTKLVIACSVAMLMVMIIWLLDQLFAPLPFGTKAAYLVGYLFLTMISVGFGFGFYWKVLESRSEATRSASNAVTQVQGSLVTAASRLDQLQQTLSELTTISSAKAIEERDFGTSCPNSRPGDGPRRRLRDADAAQFGFASSFVEGRAGQVKADLKGLDADLLKISSRDPVTFGPDGTRNAFMKNLERKLELTATRFNAFRTDPQLQQIRADLSQRSTQTIFPTGRGSGTFSCPDPQLQTALRGVVTAIDQLPELAKPDVATVEGSEAVIEAFRRLSATFYGVISFNPPPGADELRALQKEAVRKAEQGGAPSQELAQQGGLTQRDYVPLAIALFVDLCLLLVSIGRPINRMESLIPRMRAAEQGPIYQILSRFSDIHRDPEIRHKFEIFRHVVFDFNGDYYVAVPLNAPAKRNVEEANELLQQAHLLANLFSSFEKERIFTRVINPLLSNRAIRKKLARQGSSFADAEAFRVYRFSDGAWSEIILGAVMGAARRAQAERRLAAMRDGPTLSTNPTIPPTNPFAVSAPLERHDPPTADADAVSTGHWVDATETPNVAGRQQGRLRAPVALDAATRAAYGPYAHRAAQDLAKPSIHGVRSGVDVPIADEPEAVRPAQRSSSSSEAPRITSTAPSTETFADRIRRIRAQRAAAAEQEADVEIRTEPADDGGAQIAAQLPNNVVRLKDHRDLIALDPATSSDGADPVEPNEDSVSTEPDEVGAERNDDADDPTFADMREAAPDGATSDDIATREPEVTFSVNENDEVTTSPLPTIVPPPLPPSLTDMASADTDSPTEATNETQSLEPDAANSDEPLGESAITRISQRFAPTRTEEPQS